MKNRAPKILFALLTSAALAAAADVTPAPPAPSNQAASPAAGVVTDDASSLVLATKPAAAAPLPVADPDGATRSVSPGIAADLSYGMPKYNPPTPTPVQAAEPADMRDVDKPKNDIPRLPQYVVRERRPPVFRNKDLYTPKGLIDLSFKSHPGLLLGNFFGLNSGLAEEMYREDQRLIDMQDLADTAHAMTRGGDTDEARYILQETQDTYMSPVVDHSWNGPGPK